MKRKTRFLLAGLATVGGAVAGAGLLHNRRPGRGEWLHVTVFSEPGYQGRSKRLIWTGGERKVVPLTRLQLPRIGSIRLERRVYCFEPEVQPPDMYILRQALIERLDRRDPEDSMFGFIAVNQLARMFSVRLWEPVPESEAGSGVRLWAGRPGSPLSAHDEVASSDKAATSQKAATYDKAATSGEAATSGARTWHDILADTPDLGPWSTRARYLELGYRDASSPRS
ncbi:hypothetical protein [Streptomyces sp. NBC_00893]|uniref:hypothetical protein n=1 Tax=Streptomyces sp. NBC_00893 TaxID=2975862 RepID=UPI0022555B38|nr:hypothetical protein [Streptomyces sp. NBC_00893]MCX4846458.1 hypothetical protein [Streptomyces sp. NBC_00893]